MPPKPVATSGRVYDLVFELEAGAFNSKVPPPESAVNLIELMVLD